MKNAIRLIGYSLLLFIVGLAAMLLGHFLTLL